MLKTDYVTQTQKFPEFGEYNRCKVGIGGVKEGFKLLVIIEALMSSAMLGPCAPIHFHLCPNSWIYLFDQWTANP